MHIKIDCRETALYATIQRMQSKHAFFADLTLTIESLPLGDILFHHDDQDLFIIERKTIPDLISSIKDGRYEEQSYRLNGLATTPNHNIMYLIEGIPNKDTMSLMYATLASISFHKGFSVMRTTSMEDTAFFVCQFATKIKKHLKDRVPYYTVSLSKEGEEGTKEESMESFSTTTPSYATVIKKVKKENITKENIDEIMLCQIPGITSLTASAILAQYGSLASLTNHIQTVPSIVQELSSIVTTNEKGVKRKINRNCITSLCHFLGGNKSAGVVEEDEEEAIDKPSVSKKSKKGDKREV